MMNALHPVLSAAIGTGFTFLMTALGAAVVFFFRGEIKASFQQVFLGFAAGVMIAASVWSLLIPAIDMAEEQGMIGGSSGGRLCARRGSSSCCSTTCSPTCIRAATAPEGMPSSLRRTTMLVFAVTLHNIPEGMGRRALLRAGRPGRRGEHLRGGRRARHRHRASELPRGCRDLPPPQEGGALQHPLFYLRRAFGHRGTDRRHPHRADRRVGLPRHALGC